MERRQVTKFRLRQRKAAIADGSDHVNAKKINIDQPQDTSQLSSHYSQSSFGTEDDETATSKTTRPSIRCDTPAPGLNVSSNILTNPVSYANNTGGRTSPYNPISVESDALLEPSAKFMLFPKLPLEIRFKIYNLSLEPQSVYMSRRRRWVPRQAICVVCKEAKQEYERQYKILKKRASEFRPRFGPVFVNYTIDYVHFFHTSIKENITWAGMMARKLENTLDLVSWLKPAQKVAIRLRQKGGNRGLRAPKPQHEHVWERLNRACPNMKELVFIFCHSRFPIGDLVELQDFGGDIGEGEKKLRASFKAAQKHGFNVSSRLVVMGSRLEWVVSEGKLVELVDVTE